MDQPDQPVTEPALRVRDIAAMLNVDNSTVYRWIEKGSLPAYRFEDTIRVAPEDFEAFRKHSVYKPARSLASATEMDGAASRSTLSAEAVAR